MSLLSNLTTDESIQGPVDTVGGGGPLDSNLYPTTIDMAYLRKSRGGALGLNLTLKTDDGREHKETIYITSGDAKGNKNYYEKDGQRSYLPGFIIGNGIALLSIGKELSQLGTEVKAVKVYNPDQQKEVLTDVDVITDLLGQRVVVAILKSTINKRVKDASGNYVDSNETRDIAEIDKVFRERDMLTEAEIRGGATEATFHETWKKKWAGQVRNRVKAANDANGAMGAPGAGAPAAGGGAAGGSLFG